MTATTESCWDSNLLHHVQRGDRSLLTSAYVTVVAVIAIIESCCDSNSVHHPQTIGKSVLVTVVAVKATAHTNYVIFATWQALRAPWTVPFQAALVPFSLGFYKGRTRALTALSLAVLAHDAGWKLTEAMRCVAQCHSMGQVATSKAQSHAHKLSVLPGGREIG